MATTALHHNGPTLVPTPRLDAYQRPLSIAEDNQYQSLAPPMQTNRHTNGMAVPVPWDNPPSEAQQRSRSDHPPAWTNSPDNQNLDNTDMFGSDGNSYSQQHLQLNKRNSANSYALPPGAARRVIDRYCLDDHTQRTTMSGSDTFRPTATESNIQVQGDRPTSPPRTGQITQTPMRNASPQLPTPDSRYLPIPAKGTGPESSGTSSTNPTFSPAFPLAVLPSYNQALGIPVSPEPRAYAQLPTYITPQSAPNPMNPVFSPALPAPEEVCLECAMRDQDMADVDVSSPGVWERESDILYHDLVRREREERISGVVPIDPPRPRATGGRLTETNLKIWLSVNPREPASRQQTLEKYIRAQRRLLEAEVIAHARAMQEARQLDNRMRDAYSQLRRSAYDTGSSATPIDDTGGVRIKPPRSPASPTVGPHARSQSRDVTLLENGMIVEHVDVRKEEREARERKRKEERRARKSSRSSGVDVTSLYSVQSVTSPYTDSGLGVRPYSRYSPNGSTRPSSVLTTPLERPTLPRAYSQASFSDVQSLSSASPRRSRFFGMKNLSTGWRSQDSLAPSGMSGMSGSMVNMHVALQRESMHAKRAGATSLRQSHIWPAREQEAIIQDSEEKPKKKPSGFKKIWRIVTGSLKPDNNRDVSRSHERHEEDLPLAPPPPLSFLVDRRPAEIAATHSSTPSLNSTLPKNMPSSPGMSPPTAPSSVLPSPASSGRPGGDRDVVIEGRYITGMYDTREIADTKVEETWKPPSLRNVYPTILEPDARHRVLSSPSLLSNQARYTSPSRPASISDREKSLPPLPGEHRGNVPMVQQGRPLTVYTYDSRHALPQISDNHLLPQANFRGPDGRRQSFGGMASRPSNVNVSIRSQTTLPKTVGYEPGRSLSPKYEEFGFSRSLGRLEYVEEHPLPRSPTPNTKRKSKFSITSLFSKKNTNSQESSQTFPTIRRSDSHHQDDYMGNGFANGTSPPFRQNGMGPRMSVASRRAIDELVDQDPEFVAYRYPSNDQRLDLLR